MWQSVGENSAMRRLAAGMALALCAGAAAVSGSVTAAAAAVPGRSGRPTVTGTVRMVTGVVPLESRVDLKEGRRIVARESVGSTGAFHFAVGPGVYRLDVASVPRCTGTVRVRARKRSVVTAICDTWNGFRSIVAQTLPTRGRVTTRTQVIARFVSDPANRGSTRVEAVETTFGAFDKGSTPKGGGSWGGPYRPTTRVWALCASGGTYWTFTGRNSYPNQCDAYRVQTGADIASEAFDGSWPAWFTRLARTGT